MDTIVLLAMAGIVGLFFWVVSNSRAPRTAGDIQLRLRTLEGFAGASTFRSVTGEHAIAIDRCATRIAFSTVAGGKAVAKIYEAGQIVSSEVAQDGFSLTKTNRGSQLVGLAAGAALLGPVGAVVGGLSAGKRSADRVKRVVLRVTLDDMTAPVREIEFLAFECAKGDALHSTALRAAQEWNGRVEALMHRARHAQALNQ